MTTHKTGTREEWLAARLELLAAEKELTRRGDELGRAPLEKLQAYKRRMGWTFPWASSLGSDFNPDFNVSITAEQQREGDFEYNYRRGAARHLRGGQGSAARPLAETPSSPTPDGPT